jgi:hypothetical protein
MALTLAQYVAPANDISGGFDSSVPTWQGQTFTTTAAGYLTEISEIALTYSSPLSGDLHLDVYATDGSKPLGARIARATIDGSIITPSIVDYIFTYDQTVELANATVYALVVVPTSGAGFVFGKNGAGQYSGGGPTRSTDMGTFWTAPSTSWDIGFTVTGETEAAPTAGSFDAVSTFSGALHMTASGAGSLAAVSTLSGTADAPSPIEVSGSFTAAYTMSGAVTSTVPDSPTMVALTASVGDIDTTDQLMAFEAFQKVCVVNGKKKFIADFSNTLLNYTSGLTTPPLKGDILTQASSDAVMVVDFVDLTKKKIYGFRTTDEVFNTSNNITSNNVGDQVMNPASWTPDTVTDRTAGPLWYKWTRHPDGVIDLPAKAYIGCLYRGRAVLSGNPLEPYQWYMSRQGDIHDFDYVAGDAQTPVKGGNSNMGEIGDIVKALIPYKDDFLIFGCANNIYFAADDPAYGGTLNALDLTTGMYSQTAWCFTGDGTLYFWGTNGLYRTTIPGTPECITQVRLPDLVADEAADPSTHRISLQFDRRANGIGVYITKLSNGENSNWFYDLLTDGFFPESYPTECGVYSSFYYPANNSKYKGLILGGKDGHLRVFDRDAMSDDVGDTDEAIDSYVTLSPVPLSKDLDKNGEFSGWNIMAGGDSSDIYFKAYIGRTPDEVIDKIVAAGYPAVGGNFAAPGRRANNKRTQKITGAYLGIKLGNNTASESWSFEKFYGTVKPSGRIK